METVIEDYYAVYSPKGFKCHVMARNRKQAVKIGRDQGLSLPRGSYAQLIGREGYFTALKASFPQARAVLAETK